MKKITSLILCIVLTVAALTALSVAVFADEAETPAVSDITLAGYQNKNGGFDIRIVGKIANEANYREVGFVFSNGTTSPECAAKYMFKTLLASDGENTYEPLTAGEGEYLFAYIIEGIEENAALTLSVKPYAVNNDNEKIYGEEKTLVKKAGEQFEQETVHTHAPVHHEASTATAASYATAWNTEYWSCEGCSKLFSDAACTTEVEADTVMVPAQKDNADFVNSETNPYLLANAADWEAYAEAVNGGDNMSGKYVKLTADIGTEEAPITDAIGNAAAKAYAGNFDGNGKTVWVDISLNSTAGVFAYMSDGSVKDLTVRGSVTRSGSPTSTSGAGGIVGMVPSSGTGVTISGCNNYATVTAPANCSAGGIVGYNSNIVVIRDCTNYGKIVSNVSASGSTSAVTGGGGILGFASATATIDNCENKGEVGGTRSLGGIVGGASNAVTANHVTNSGTVTGTGNYVGGIIGYINSTGSVLTNCTNTGNITGAQGVGGIIGLLNSSKTATVDNATVKDCTVSGTGSVGGVIGRIATKATATYKNYTAPTNVTYMVSDAEANATAGFTTTGRTDAAYATPGEAFGSCAGTATNADETTA